jgi:hypothetical protein
LFFGLQAVDGGRCLSDFVWKWSLTRYTVMLASHHKDSASCWFWGELFGGQRENVSLAEISNTGGSCL